MKVIHGAGWDRNRDDQALTSGRPKNVIGDDEAELRLLEVCVRVAAEVRDLVSMMKRARAAITLEDHWLLLVEATERLDGFERAHRMLAAPVPRRTELATDLRCLCASLMAGRYGAYGRNAWFRFDLQEMSVDGTTARRMLLVAANLVTARVPALCSPEEVTPLNVTLKAKGRQIVLVVDGSGLAAGRRLGQRMMIELVSSGNGRVRRYMDDIVRVAMPAAILEIWPF